MPSWWQSLLIFLGIVAWIRLTGLCHDWSHEREKDPATWAKCLLFWPIGLMALWDQPSLGPKETMAERSLRLERELGLVFDGVFLLPGYHGKTSSNADE